MLTTNLRPFFFRLGSTDAIHSGWVHARLDGLRVQLDIWALRDDLIALGLSMVLTDPEAAARLVSLPEAPSGLCLVPGARPALLCGERVTFTKDCAYEPLTTVRAGERAVVGRRDLDTGVIELFMEEYHHGLEDYSNTLTIVPFNEGELLAALQPLTDAYTVPPIVVVEDFIKAA